MLRPRKSLGQNFLVDPNTIRKIVDSLEAPADARVVEIGPGTGALTRLLNERYQYFTAIEIDERAVRLLKSDIPDLDVRHGDILEVDWAEFADADRPMYVIGNLPYYITSQILFGLIEARADIQRAVLMMQLEVAERLVAEPRTKAYGILSVAVQLAAEPHLLFRVSRNVFYPKPDVTSAVVALDLFPAPAIEGVDEAFVRTVIRTAFNQRRKTLRNSLGGLVEGKELPDEFSGRRAEELTPQEFVELAKFLADGNSH